MFIADTLGVGIAGASAPWRHEVLDMAGISGGAAEATVWGSGEKLPLAQAAMVNAYQIHSQEFDCVHEGAVVHPMAAILPCLLGWAEREGGVSGERLIRAVIAGVDVAVNLGLCSRAPMRFFRPANCGGFGATAGSRAIRRPRREADPRCARHLLRAMRRHDAGACRGEPATGDADGLCGARRGDRDRIGAARHARPPRADFGTIRLFRAVRRRSRSRAVRRTRPGLADLRVEPQAVALRPRDAWRPRRPAAADRGASGSHPIRSRPDVSSCRRSLIGLSAARRMKR